MADLIFLKALKDKLKVSDPHLYEYLEAHKYHIIKKETKTGVIYQILIYKE